LKIQDLFKNESLQEYSERTKLEGVIHWMDIR